MQDGPCENDFLEVLDADGNSTERHCGEYTTEDSNPLVITSETNVLKIRFQSDNLFRYRGFKCRYRAMYPNGVAAINSYLAGEETNGMLKVQALFLCAPSLSKKEYVHLFSSSLPHLDKCQETSRIFPRTT